MAGRPQEQDGDCLSTGMGLGAAECSEQQAGLGGALPGHRDEAWSGRGSSSTLMAG